MSGSRPAMAGVTPGRPAPAVLPSSERAAPPLWVRTLAQVVRRTPVGPYWLVHFARRWSPPPFVAHLAPALGGYAFTCHHGDSVAREVCYTGRYEPQETQIVSRLLRSGGVFVDVGANWGYFTLAAAHCVGPSGRVIAFEPEPRLFALLEANVAMNALGHVQLHRVGAAADRRTLRFVAFSTTSGNWGESRSIAGAGNADFECEAMAVDEALDADRVHHVDLIKIDVEGAEVDVLAGMRRGLREHRYARVLLECHVDLLAQRGESTSSCFLPLTDAGYRLFLVTHTPAMHRLASRQTVPMGELLRPYRDGAPLGRWPHVLAVAPGLPDPV